MHRDLIIKQIQQILPKNATLTIFLTRAKINYLSNLGTITGNFPINSMITNSSMNPFNAFNNVP